MQELLSTKEIAKFLDINEKMVYSLISEKGLPGTKITGKWLFPKHLVKQWVENHTINYPEPSNILPPYHGLLIITGSNDPLLDKAISMFNNLYTEHVAVFGNLGSMGGLRALRQNLCHMASSHLLQENEKEYNFEYAGRELKKMPAVINFCMREQGFIIQKGNPKQIRGISDFTQKGLKIVNRPLGTGTRLLFDLELEKAGIAPEKLEGYQNETAKHIDAGIEILTGKADICPGIRPVASILGLDFIPLRWERYDLVVRKERFFEQGIQLFISMLHEKDFIDLAENIKGYDLSMSGKMVFPLEDKK
ncbi:Phosphate-binding protein [Desulfonema limicola]|uniref:Phosphate-binding protein n=1 Tax=Desulfonema limicola TaxID=45656 RepID=A0A975GEM8_9BACT|nr:helix-turn-helix transcriptional regulator [Desulfonema limicola]QTA78284.1 Phosphate-binding protein [Desulfonema limicola]